MCHRWHHACPYTDNGHCWTHLWHQWCQRTVLFVGCHILMMQMSSFLLVLSVLLIRYIPHSKYMLCSALNACQTQPSQSGSQTSESHGDRWANWFMDCGHTGVNAHASDLPPFFISHELLPRGFSVNVNLEPSLLYGSDSFAMITSDNLRAAQHHMPQVLPNETEGTSRPSDRGLNCDFKFGRKQSPNRKESSLLILSGIILPLEIVRSLSMALFAGGESLLMKLILAHAIKVKSPSEDPWLDSNSSSKHKAQCCSKFLCHHWSLVQ